MGSQLKRILQNISTRLKVGEIAKGVPKWALEEVGKATQAAITRLKGLGATSEMIETALRNGANLEHTRRIGSRVGGIGWLEESRWTHLRDKHILPGGDWAKFSEAGIPEEQVEGKIFDTIKNPVKTIENSNSKRLCLFSEVISGISQYKYVKVVMGENGYIITAQPINTLTCTD